VEFKSPSNRNIPAACGPYSRAAIAGGCVFLAGQTGRDPRTGKVIEGDIEAHARLTHPTKLESRSWFNSFK
jgi:enamine deaminase RidA (YjgF/YER057c/UK114 family)